MVEVYQHPRIRLMTYSEVESVDGYIGNFRVTVRRKARSIDESLCNGCGACITACPNKRIPSEFDCGLGKRTAVYVPFPQAVPNIPVIDRERCTLFVARSKGKKDACMKCQTACTRGAIAFDQQDALVTEDVGAIVVATGYQLYDIGRAQPKADLRGYGEYGYGTIPDVTVTTVEYLQAGAAGEQFAPTCDPATDTAQRITIVVGGRSADVVKRDPTAVTP